MTNSINSFKKLCNNINEIASSFDGKEEIEHSIAFEAYAYIKTMKLDEEGDYLLFLAATNLLNTYVKQKDSKITYRFKNDLSFCIDRLFFSKNDFLSYNVDDDKLLIFSLENLQFSFHYVKLHLITDITYNPDIKWDQIRKQPCALTIYNICKSNRLLISNKTIRGRDLDKTVSRYLDNYLNSKMDFNDI